MHGAGKWVSGAVVSLVASAWPLRAVPPELVERGQRLYEVYCSSCHGEAGRGDGPTADVLLVKPGDLTRLSRSSGGEFPFDRVYRTIDGRECIPAHGEGKMPIWGVGLQDLASDTNQEDQVRGKILQLMHYLESIQQPAR